MSDKGYLRLVREGETMPKAKGEAAAATKLAQANRRIRDLEAQLRIAQNDMRAVVEERDDLQEELAQEPDRKWLDDALEELGVANRPPTGEECAKLLLETIKGLSEKLGCDGLAVNRWHHTIESLRSDADTLKYIGDCAGSAWDVSDALAKCREDRAKLLAYAGLTDREWSAAGGACESDFDESMDDLLRLL